MSGPIRLTDSMTPWLTEAFELHALGEPITWEAFPQMVQTQQGIIPHILVVVMLPGAVLGQVHIDATQHPFPAINEEYVGALVKGAVERLLAHRSAELATGNGHGGPPKTSKGGLIIP